MRTMARHGKAILVLAITASAALATRPATNHPTKIAAGRASSCWRSLAEVP